MSKVTTKTEVRLSYTNLIEARAQNEGDDPTFSTQLLIPKSDTDTIKAIQAAIKEALAEGVSKKWNGKRPGNLRNPLRDGDTEEDKDGNPRAPGHFFMNAKGPRAGKEKAVLLDKNGAETADPEVIYSGVYARVSIQFYPYATNGNNGVACGVTSVLSGQHGDPLGNTVTASSARNEFGVSTPASSAAGEFAESAESGSSDADDDDPWAK